MSSICLKVFAFLSVSLLFAGLSGAQSDFENDFPTVEQGEEQEKEEKQPVLYMIFWILGQIFLVYQLGIMFFDIGGVTKAISVVGIMIPWQFITGFIPFGFVPAIAGYMFMIKFRFDTDYKMAALTVIPLIAYQYLLVLLFL